MITPTVLAALVALTDALSLDVACRIADLWAIRLKLDHTVVYVNCQCTCSNTSLAVSTPEPLRDKVVSLVRQRFRAWVSHRVVDPSPMTRLLRTEECCTGLVYIELNRGGDHWLERADLASWLSVHLFAVLPRIKVIEI